MKIGAVAAEGRVNLQTVRYYEREGLLPAAPRLSSGYRVFPENTAKRVRFIKRAQELGFSLAEIRELLLLRVDDERDRADVRAIARARVSSIEEKIQALARMKAALAHLIEKCSGHGPASECPILDCLDSEEPL